MSHQSNKLKTAFQNGTFFPVVAHALRNRWPLCWVENKSVRDLQLQDRAYKILKRKYGNLLANLPHDGDQSGRIPKQIWLCWLQGMDQAPDLVQACYASLKREFPDYEITVVTEKNLSDYVTLPDYITEKWQQGIIGNAHFSDVLRLALLAQYGGIWIDATVYATGRSTLSVIERGSFFMFKSLSAVEEHISSSNWLIASSANHQLVLAMQQLLYAYWEKEKVAIHYYVFHLFFTLVTENYPELWKAVPTYTNAAPHVMVDELNDAYSDERFEQLAHISDFHKLNYKKSFKNDAPTLYAHILDY